MMYKKEVGQILGSDQLLCVWGKMMSGLVFVFFVVDGVVVEFWEVQEFAQGHAEDSCDFVEGADFGVLAFASEDVVYCGLA